MQLNNTNDADKLVNPIDFESDLVDPWVQINPEIQIRIVDQFWLS